jgi:ATP-dependent RNA helicase RhlE
LTQFSELGLSKQMLATMIGLGYETPTPIQRDAIPLVLKGHDLIGLAQTGTGKTAAFGVPLIEQLVAEDKRPEPKSVRALILAPTRELVNQIAANLKDFVRNTPLKVGVVVGVVSINPQIKNVGRWLDVLVATPGRLLDLVDRRALSLHQVHRLVLDEADQMLDLGFVHDLKKIVKLVPKRRQTLLFSATMPKQIADLADAYLAEPLKVEVSPPGKAADKITQSVHFVGDKGSKTDLLRKCLSENPDGLALVCGRTKHGSEKLVKQLVAAGFAAASIHGNKSQNQRERALKAFRDGEVRVLVATDVAARGIDIPGVTHVYNYELPEVADAYVHRIGRTARAGRSGEAVAFCAPDEIRLLRDVEKLMGISIDVASGTAPADQARPPRGGGGKRGGNGGGNRSGQPARREQSGAPAAPGARNKRFRNKKRPGGGEGKPVGAGDNRRDRRQA